MSRIFSKIKELQDQKNTAPSQPSVTEQPSVTAQPSITVKPPVSVQPEIKANVETPKFNIDPLPEIKTQASPQKTPFALILGIIVTISIFVLLSILAFKISDIKNDTLVTYNRKIQQDHAQVLILTKKLLTLQNTIDSHIQKTDIHLKTYKNNIDHEIDNLSTSVDSRLEQVSANENRMEAVLQSNIDQLNDKLNKLQSSTPAMPKSDNQNSSNNN